MQTLDENLLLITKKKTEIYTKVEKHEYIPEKDIYEPNKVHTYVEQVLETSKAIQELKELCISLKDLYSQILDDPEYFDTFASTNRKFTEVLVSIVFGHVSVVSSDWVCGQDWGFCQIHEESFSPGKAKPVITVRESPTDFVEERWEEYLRSR